MFLMENLIVLFLLCYYHCCSIWQHPSLILRGKCQFVRCIRSNNERQPGKFCEQTVMRQLQSYVVPDTAMIRRRGFPVKHTFEDFAALFVFSYISSKLQYIINFFAFFNFFMYNLIMYIIIMYA